MVKFTSGYFAEPVLRVPAAEVLSGDCRVILPTLESQSVQCCVTSPPYWGLRDYGTAEWEGGDAGCDHSNVRRDHGDEKQSTQNGSSRDKVGRECRFCGALRMDSQLGLESTPEEYVANMVGVFREVWRVLRDDGTLWLNMGDSYASTGRSDRKESPGVGATQAMDAPGRKLKWQAGGGHNFSWSIPSFGMEIKPKDLCGIPWRLAFALQADGWYLRSDIIWHKPNPMPESVTDRPTKAHEYLFLLAKAEKYFYDAEAIRENSIRAGDIPGGSNGFISDITGGHCKDGLAANGKKPVRDFRNKRSVWTIATQPYAETHFATFPEDLVKPCILAGSRPCDTILDPFGGSGTVGQVALELGRSATLIELSPDYCELARARTNVTPGFVW